MLRSVTPPKKYFPDTHFLPGYVAKVTKVTKVTPITQNYSMGKNTWKFGKLTVFVFNSHLRQTKDCTILLPVVAQSCRLGVATDD